jgi:hypothetical protein
MTCVRKDNDWERRERGYWTSPMEDSNSSSVGKSVSFDEMRKYEDNKICNRKQSNNAGVLQRVKATQKR